LKNSKLIEPFEAVTNIYGQPKYHELDPTGPLALFFLVSFSLALTDAGYGLVMMGGMWLAQRHLKLKRPVKKMVRLLFYAGAATVLAGALTGGWFGIELEKLPASQAKNLLLSFKLVDPVQSPMSLLVVAFVVGIIQLLFAWVVRAYDHARQKDYIALIFDDIGWILMVVFILSWALSSRGVLLVNWTRPLLIAVIVVASLLVLTGGRSFKNPALKLGGGLLSLYGLVSFLSDTLSYSRLLALGLATGIIGLVVNMLGVMVGTSVPVVGWVIAAVVLLVGHVFNLGINALGAFIHSGRLQFVEFFPKFLEGGGKPYRPLGRVSRYVDNPKEFI
jgi:V/A-type H+-transporting ATPase subunit I